MELFKSEGYESISVYESPTPQELQAMKVGKCVLLKQYAGTIPISLAYSRPDRSELHGYIEGELTIRYDVMFPEILTGRLAIVAYQNRVEAAVTELIDFLGDL
ncbi:MAG: hypothetical protein QFB87_03225 [Patescibacteria group bacterium]|nr:hypothetical protein [Patescibacteria group bacterium]